MLRSRLLPLGLASGVALTLAACQDNSNPTAPDGVPPSDRVQVSQGADLPIDGAAWSGPFYVRTNLISTSAINALAQSMKIP